RGEGGRRAAGRGAGGAPRGPGDRGAPRGGAPATRTGHGRSRRGSSRRARAGVARRRRRGAARVSRNVGRREAPDVRVLTRLRRVKRFMGGNQFSPLAPLFFPQASESCPTRERGAGWGAPGASAFRVAAGGPGVTQVT